MKLKEAIETGTLIDHADNWALYDEDIDAIQLLIEAAKRILECRLADHIISEDWLPGETKE